MKSIGEVLGEVAKAFDQQGMFCSRNQAEDLMCDLLKCNRLKLYAYEQRLLTAVEYDVCQSWVDRRLKGEPLAYIYGSIQFYECAIKVSPSVLIPRQETEILVDKIVHHLKDESLKGKVLWDLCCGSGCIGIALKKALPDLTVTLSDYSQEALEIAKENARFNAVDVTCVQGDLFQPFDQQRAHFIVCNPPYISENEYVGLDKEVKNYEPYLALVGGVSGLEMYQRLAKELPLYLYSNGWVWLELGYQQGKDVQKIFSGLPWKNQRLENDWAGHNRFFFLENE